MQTGGASVGPAPRPGFTDGRRGFAVSGKVLGMHILSLRRFAAALTVAVLAAAALVPVTAAPGHGASPARCGPDDVPETGLQGQVPRAEQEAGFEGFRCGMRLLGQHTVNDRGGNHQLATLGDCAYLGTTALLGANPAYPDTGIAVIDASKPQEPELLRILRHPGSIDATEALHARNGIIAASSYNQLDIYDASEDCRDPQLKATFQLPVSTHGFRLSDDAKTVYAMAFGAQPGGSIVVVDISDPANPRQLLVYNDHTGHDMDLRPDGKRAYIAGEEGLIILDTSDIQARRENPEITTVSKITWPGGNSHTAMWVRRAGREYVLSANEAFGPTCDFRPQARHIDITDETKPVIVADVKLEVNDPATCAEHNVDDDKLTYNSHYVGVDDKFDAQLVFWNWFSSGIRVFDFRNPRRPKEIAYYNPPVKRDTAQRGSPIGAHADDSHEMDRADMTTPYMWYRADSGQLLFSSTHNGFQIAELTAHARRVNDLPPVANACAGGAPRARYRDRDSVGETHGASVDCATHREVVRGFKDRTYRPRVAVRRDQMATYVAEVLDEARGAQQLPASTAADGFRDIAGNAHARSIRRLVAAGIVSGRTAQRYAPARPVQRDQMATFLLRAAEYAAGLEPGTLQSDDPAFDDVARRNPHAANVNGARAQRIVAGNGNTYNPGARTQRDQMATFVTRLLGYIEARAG